MKETFYFSHDYNARNDEKIKLLIRKFGMIGYGIYWSIVEDLYNNANALRTDYDGIAYDLRTDIETIKSIINDFELFIIDDGNFGSNSVERRLNERSNKSNKARESASYRWKKNNEDANALQPHSERNAIKERKGKEIKENDNNEVFSFRKSLITFGVDKTLLTEWLEVRKKKKLTNSETAFKAIQREIYKTNLTPTECIKIAVEKSWGGFDAEWIINLKNKNTNGNDRRNIADLDHKTATKLADM